jgi:hypothetical protein
VQGNNAANIESEDIMRDTLEMARKAGLEITVDPTETPLRTFVEGWDDQLKAFEALVRADERAASVQEPVAWVGLERSDMPDGEDPMFDHPYFIKGMVYAANKLVEKNNAPKKGKP